MDKGTHQMLCIARGLLGTNRSKRVLDIGTGAGGGSNGFRQDGHDVTAIGLMPESYGNTENVIDADYNTHQFPLRFDAIWCSHVLEHQPNVNAFVSKMRDDLKTGGWLFVIVPPMKPFIVGGHLNLFNEGLLVYNLIIGGFDCKHATVGRIGYNICCFVRKAPMKLPDLRFDRGDIESLEPFFPFAVSQGFDGDNISARWDKPPVRRK